MQIKNQRRARPLVQQLRRRRSLRAGLAQLVYVATGIGFGLLVPTLSTPAPGSRAPRWRRCWRGSPQACSR